MKNLKQEYFWNGNEALSSAAHMVLELYGLNDLQVDNWLGYDEVNLLDKVYKPHKETLLHDYINFIYFYNYEYLLDKHFPMEVINSLVAILKIYNVDYSHLGEAPFIGLNDDDVIHGYDNSLVEEFANKILEFYRNELGIIIVSDIFTVLFANKQFLFEFNRQIQKEVRVLILNEYPNHLKKDGVVKRCPYLPKWLKKGIFMRDKGRCQICGTDLTKILHLDNQENYDHIIPLESGGTNDPNNFQLTCEHCNKSKGHRSTTYNSFSARFWEINKG
ncbi:hypothetical protein CKN63_13175 [Carnobacterium divergens]|uniref:HNH endonuclease n=1 Tax=Carnobacterium TaxID=2747 RepID=UPI001072ECC4|nr:MULTISPECIES: HNH endonuclease [Carnobacterium]MDW5525275.1 HNH endonuclease [Carnobacterium maltaromaticum]TFI60639.1 hypothetical protein CKN59_13115 [Carnobacterium divergens]TFI61481.1 hypothetical protein CKN76_13130 [Carnobacterium divergens]TFI77080.1 hypothetical protein CKN74_12880 [Carnobacterium divergens]TFJ01405.1 hypothetical protein CKN75_12455 [Carnobacterium divergens]